MQGNLSSKIRHALVKISPAFTRREYIFMIVMGGIAGAVGGFGAIGFRRLILTVALKDGRMRTRVVFAKAFASAICIGSGGSVGREGPIVQNII